ncbi:MULTISPECIES: NAD(P)/FAD-dependent oxidoreductase [Acidianus]|uniref:Pyridine nucleotide-disulfide oxidoreductase n=1 Tax=Candidatus Acidianus copahuensis TaxID=1160895 RepID=A0A031LL18_9CREN|nr:MULTISPECIES: FAD/NAD(P)-binding oxidoreductase [Acidianus]EZQ02253.1 pyridine nucleotide-disulfide oxidoreductase [Candidatus Acidianus copahuensis]NON61931.1 NAD(P)/FAD-dependent oxidoreductase [Acidianus sp. RZ1]
MKRIVVAGGGIAGTIVANRLVRNLSEEVNKGEVEIVVLNKANEHIYQPGQALLPFGVTETDELIKKEREVLDPRVKLLHDQKGDITKFDPANHEIRTADGLSHRYDYLIIATGSHLHWEDIPGYKDAVYSPWDMESAQKLREALDQFSGGTVVINVSRLPHKCPVAPMEVTLMLDDYLKRRGLREKTEIVYTYPVPGIFGIKTTNDVMIKIFQDRGIKVISPFTVTKIDPKERIMESQEGEKVKFDLAIGVPVHYGAKVLADSGLPIEGRNWVKTDKMTLRMEGHSDVYVIGDTTNLPISKAGSTADFESYVITGNIAGEIRGNKGRKFYDGSVFCYIATGLDSGTYIRFNYNYPPVPPPPSYVHWWGKLMYNKLYWTVTAKAIV